MSDSSPEDQIYRELLEIERTAGYMADEVTRYLQGKRFALEHVLDEVNRMQESAAKVRALTMEAEL